MKKFPYLRSNSKFPDIGNVNVYQYDNEFDYSRYVPTQMKITMCAVPWDMGEAHIGARTISGIGNVVHFGSKANRDAWFAAIPDSECYRFETKYKELHKDLFIDVPVPFDVCAHYNYIMVEYSLFANDDSPVMYETENGVRKWFWFVREVEMLAANTTRLHLLDDAFQTWIYDVDVTGMVLERGHAPMFAMKAAQYLSNPVGNNDYLLTEDVNFGQASTVRHVEALGLNSGDTVACIATTANPRGAWGTKSAGTWNVPTSDYNNVQGQPSVKVFAVDLDDLNVFLTNVVRLVPQFAQTVKGVFFASKALVTIGASFTFADTTCHEVSATRKQLDLIELDTQMFGYPEQYIDIAKLYTSPYAHLEITDENGNVDVVRIEDSTGTLRVSAAMSLAWPYISIDAHLLGTGGNAGSTVTFRNLDAHDFPVAGMWYETLRTWEVPTFAVILSPATEYDYSSHFDRVQRKNDYDTAFANTSASASTNKTNSDNVALSARNNANDSASTTKTNADSKASTAKTNADASADTAKSNTTLATTAAKNNADADADLVTDNATLAETANTAITTASNASADRSLNATRTYNFDVYDSNNAITNATASATTQAQEQQAAISAGSGAASAAVGAISSAATGNVAGAISSAINGLIGAGSTLASSDVAIHLTQAEAAIAILNNGYQAEAATTKSDSDTQNQKTTAVNMRDIQNTLTTSQAANNAATTKANATRTKTANDSAATNTQTTEKNNNARSYTTETNANANTYNTDTGNASRTYNTEIAANTATYNTSVANATRTRDNAAADVANDVKQAALRAPFEFGRFSGGNGTTKPIALFANVVTQSKSAIASAGDEFLRYGYTLDKQWDFDGNWNVGKYFTYWKLRDFWVSNLNVPDMYMDRLRFFLFGGVTIWKNPEDIGKRNIYENFQ